MTHRILVVDDSSFFLSRLKEIIEEHPELEVVGCASNGQQAIELDQTLRPDVITMDYEMPGVDGITAVKAILAKRRVPILMFSSMTYNGAKITLESLEAGAVDFLPKNFADVSKKTAHLKALLHKKLITFAQNSKPTSPQLKLKKSTTQSTVVGASAENKTVKKLENKTANNITLEKISADVLIIGASTGGPVALAKIVCRLEATFPVPIVVIQHMPAQFTATFAERLNREAALAISEAKDGDELKPGRVLIAPGGKQLMFHRSGKSVKIIDGDERLDYKPSVDIAFASAANTFKGATMGVILTGMGSDGCDGARLLKEHKAKIWAQDEHSSMVFGMPAAVANSGLVDCVLPIDDFAPSLAAQVIQR